MCRTYLLNFNVFFFFLCEWIVVELCLCQVSNSILWTRITYNIRNIYALHRLIYMYSSILSSSHSWNYCILQQLYIDYKIITYITCIELHQGRNQIHVFQYFMVNFVTWLYYSVQYCTVYYSNIHLLVTIGFLL